jgi:hypothetical protein
VKDQANNLESVTGEKKNRWDVIPGALPFALFGIAMMLGKSSLPIHAAYPELGFFIVVLIGLVIGLAKGFPRWAYSYLGWSMVMSWSWMMMPMYTFQTYRPPVTHNQLIGWWSWTPFILTLGIGLLLARSFRPIRQMLLGIWRDWTLASFMIYTFVAFVVLIYDENHHPYLFLFMTASTIIFSASVWIYMQSIDTRKRALALLSGFVLAFATMYICDATWDWHNGYPRTIKFELEYEIVSSYAVFLVFYGLILLMPVLVGFIRSIVVNKETMT